MKTVPCFLAVAFAVVLALPLRAQNVRLWSGNSGGAWLTAGNWSGGNVFAGATDLASPLPAQGRPDDIMASAAGNRAASIGLNMSTVTAGNSGRGLTLGGIDWERTDAGACVIGNSSTAAGGILRLRGASLGGEPNTFVRLAGGGDLTLSRASSGTPAAAQRMTLELGHAAGNFVVAPERTLTLTPSEITEALPASGFTLKGGGTLTIAAPSRLTGPTIVGAGRLLAAVPEALGSGDLTVSDGGQLMLTANAANPVNIAGMGWPEPDGPRGALILEDAILSGSLNVTSPSRVGIPAGRTGHLTGPLVGSADLEINSDQTGMTGLLVLSGNASAFRGGLRVTTGELRVTSSQGPAGSVSVADRAQLSGEGSLGGNLMLGNTDGAALHINTGTSDSLKVAGTVSVAGELTVVPDAFLRGTHQVLTAGQFSAALSQFSLPGGLSTYRPGTGFQLSGNSLLLTMAPEAIEWTAAQSDQWSTSPLNWTGPGARFHSGDAVVFPDPPRGGSVVVATDVFPGSVSIANDTGHYRFTGSGGLAGTAALTKSGRGTATLATANHYTGGTTVLGGILVLETANALPSTGPLTVAAGTLRVLSPHGIDPALTVSMGSPDSDGDQILEIPGAATADETVLSCEIDLHPTAAGRAILRGPLPAPPNHSAAVTGPISLNGRSLWLEHAADAPGSPAPPWQLNGRISGPGEVVINASSQATILRLGYHGNDFTGNLILQRGTLQCGPVGTTAFNAIPNTASLLFGSGTRLLLGSPETVGALVDGGPDPANGRTAAGISPAAGSGSVTLTVGGGDASGTYHGTIANEGNRTLALAKTGTGTQILLGPCTHTGNTTVSAGRLVIGSSWAAPITVSGGATLAGTAVSSSSITATSTGSGGANLAPGNPTGVFTAASANLSGGGNLRITIDDDATAPCSQLRIAGNLNITGTDLHVSGTPTAAVYVIATYGSLTGTFASTAVPDQYRLVYGYDSGNGQPSLALVRENADAYPAWAASYGLTGAAAEPTADPDRDGVPNVLEFHFDGHPLNGDAPGITATAVPGALRIQYLRRDDAESLQTILESTDDPGSGPWIPIQPGTGGITSGISENGPGPDSIQVTIPSTTVRQFYRLRVSGP
jgi:autotransporter-associated beta strand protein